jgi:hypothetical protein
VDPFLGLLLVLCVLTLIHFGPAWGTRFAGKSKRFKRLIPMPGDPKCDPLVGRRKYNR